MRALSTNEPSEPGLSRAERRAAAKGRKGSVESPRAVELPGRGKNVVHDRSRYAIRRRG
ncbi:hypothetical protein [Cryptosporangium arvum]|uniref:Uncharacterized protein n=1 Tax=Cryptosporangium arvum DSM 44712 TaxID=927661 RepID=A0A011AB10_9ACTN|nr:hypothetical protein [Cryptosporangium arvum]EXG79201.1 hypothetical protein CryarDRAFT_0229 [Cryptosporangium arvum DSM 44712]